MVNVWVLTVIFMTGWGTTSQTYEFKDRNECVTAQQWYKKAYSGEHIRTTCYPSLPTK